MIEVFIDRWRTGFAVRTSNFALLGAISSHNQQLVSPKINRVRGKVIIVPGDEYFIRDKQRDQIVYCDAHWDEFKKFLDIFKTTSRNPVKVDIQYVKKKYTGQPVKFDRHTLTLVETDEYWMWQNAASDLALEEGRYHTIFEVQMGLGKTKSAMKFMIKAGVRTIIITKAAYVTKWKGDVVDGLRPRGGELVVIDSLDALEDLFLIATAGRMNSTGKGDKDIKVILISSHCIDNYIQRWCSGEHFKVAPYDFMEKLGIGLTVYDEVHQLFRMNYWSFIMLDQCNVLDLSATLTPDQDFMKARYLERLPLASRFTKEFDAYVEMYGIYFNWADHKAVQKINRLGMYNHTEFEKAIMRKPKAELEYFSMLNAMLQPWFFKIWEPGDKALIILATKEMCTRFAKYMKSRHPGKDVQRYIQGDKYEVAKKADIIVSTKGKSGTAVDYEGLIINLTTVAVDDTQSSEQILGRTRKTTLFKRGIAPKIVYPVCKQVLKQGRYYVKRQQKFQGKVTKMVTMSSNFVIH